MNPSTGTFTSVDPEDGCIECAMSLHRYLYAEASPITKSDPSGSVTLVEVTTVSYIQTQMRRAETTTKVSRLRQIQGNICSATARLLKVGNDVYEKFMYKNMKLLTSGSKFQAHHIIQNAPMLALFGSYSSGFGLAMPILKEFHFDATGIQLRMKGKPLTSVAVVALVAAGCKERDANEIVKAVENYNQINDWLP